MIGSWSAGLVRRWVELYTRGLPVDVRGRRREEIEADLWSQLEEASLIGRSERSTSGEILVRLLAGVPADVTWRLAHMSDDPVPSGVHGVSTSGTRAVGLLAITGGIGLSIFVGLVVGDSVARPELSRDALWADPVLGLVLILSGFSGFFALAVATAGLVLLFQERIGRAVAIAGSIGSMGGLLGMFGGWPLVLLPLGSAVVIVSLGLGRVIGRWLALAYVVSAVAFVVPVVLAPTATDQIAAVIVLLAPYGLAWMAIGASIVRGVRVAEAAPGP